jgi:hypothetical protein
MVFDGPGVHTVMEFLPFMTVLAYTHMLRDAGFI